MNYNYLKVPIASVRNPGLFPPLPLGDFLNDSSRYYLRGDGTWEEVKPPPVEHEDLHTESGEYDG